MFHLLRADFYRAFRFKAWYILLAANAVIAIFSVGNICSFAYIGETVSAFDSMVNGFGGSSGVVGIMCAVLVAVFVGREFSGGAVRNKIASGCGRTKLWLSLLITCSAMCVSVYLAFHAVNFTLGSALLGWNGLTFAEVFLPFLAGLCMTLAYSAVFTAVTMLSRSTVAGLLVGILGTIFVTVAVVLLQGELAVVTVYDPEAGGYIVVKECRWPVAVQRMARAFIALMPSGQSMLLSQAAADSSQCGLYIGLSCAWVALSAVGGPLLFRRANLK